MLVVVMDIGKKPRTFKYGIRSKGKTASQIVPKGKRLGWLIASVKATQIH
jgi:hypothetical protein